MQETKQNTALAEKKPDLSYAHQNRRYIGTKETAGYVLNSWAGGFNVNKYNDRFIYDVLLINFKYLALLDSVGGVWDIINDTIFGSIVDKTRTRWGKFRPYLIGFSIPMTFLAALYWFMPLAFEGTDDMYLPKFAAYFIFKVIQETAGTFTGIASEGLLSTLTPFPVERTRLIVQAQLLAIGSNVPELVMGLMLDLVNNKVVGWKLRNLFLGFGLFTNFVAAGAAFFFFITSKERVQQSIEVPSLWQGIKSIFNNKPLLLITLSEFLEGFSIKTGMTDYYIDVLGSATLQTIVGIPGGLFSYSSYGYVGKVRERFSTRGLWIFTDLWTDACWLGVCVVGSINKNFMKRGVMVPTIMIEECFEMMIYAIQKVLPRELTNESMDYCEWKNGYRTEAMTGVAKGLINKAQRIANSTVRRLVMQKIGYTQGRAIGTQDERTKFWLFLLSTGIPVITGALGVIPKFFYPLTGEKRDRMYAELAARREATAKAVNHASAEELAEIGKQQMQDAQTPRGEL